LLSITHPLALASLERERSGPSLTLREGALITKLGAAFPPLKVRGGTKGGVMNKIRQTRKSYKVK